jgi:prepilin-type N-terminal cleavage/methylation domain-containing protein
MKKHGFTLIEVLIAILLVGLAIASLLVANGSFTKANAAATDLSTAEFLIEQIREQTVTTLFADLATEFNTSGFVSTSYPGYLQQTKVEYVIASDLRTVSPSLPTPFRRITVEIRLNNKTISSASWLRADIDN